MSARASAAALCCGAALFGAVAKEILPSTGPIGSTTAQRLLLVDAERRGNRVVAVGDRGYVIYSEDQGKTWKRAKAPAAPLLSAVHFLDDQNGLAAGHDSVILATRDGGQTWTQAFSAPAEQRPLLDILYQSKDAAIAVGAYGAYYETADGGKSWNAKKVLPDDKHLNAIVDMGSGGLVLLGEAGTILVSNDAGKTWTASTSPYKGSFFGGLLANDGAVVIYGMRGRIFRSVDRGKTWKPVENASVAPLMGGDKLPDGSLVITGGAGTALVSRDNGQTFQPIATGTTRAFSKALLGGADKVLVFGEAGVREIAVPWSSKR